MSNDWQFWIDRGGTFTDVVALDPLGKLHISKLLSENPGRYKDAAAEGIRRVLDTNETSCATLTAIKMGTTVATNALLEHAGEPTVFITTRGFGDALTIGNQSRSDIFALKIEKNRPAYNMVIEVEERITANGEVLCKLNEEQARTSFCRALDAGIRSAAICLMHGYAFPQHEQRLKEIAFEAGFNYISVSHEISGLQHFVSRGQTTVIDAYVSPVLQRYINSFSDSLSNANNNPANFLMMQSNGGLVQANQLRGKDSILSGPAGGMVGMADAGKRAGISRLIGFDMGGTSSDVSVFDDGHELSYETEIGGSFIQTPMINIHTIAAGGGSVLEYADGRLQTGPESAGAFPGPLSYLRNGPLTITDANIMTGRIQADTFPAIFGPDSRQQLGVAAVKKAFGELTQRINQKSGSNYTPEETANGFVRIANENMANAIRHIAAKQGKNLTEFTLCCFGGAGGQHACEVADLLGIRKILIDPLASVLSAYGIGIAPVTKVLQQTVNLAITKDIDSIKATAKQLLQQCEAEFLQQTELAAQPETVIRLFVKIKDSDNTLALVTTNFKNIEKKFAEQHEVRFGFNVAGNAELIVETIEIVSSEAMTKNNKFQLQSTSLTKIPETVSLYLNNKWHEARCISRNNINSDIDVSGPALIVEANSSTVVSQGWTAAINMAQQLVLTRNHNAESSNISTSDPDPVLLEVFNNRFMHIASQMGDALQASARSTNIKERFDFSCAIFNAKGELIANAPHIPVHLGSMDSSVQNLLRQYKPGLLAGNVYVSNAPFSGGTHLPDITVVSPVLNSKTGKLECLLASRAHHADVGGITPGSMPPTSKSISEEGILFDGFCIIKNGHFQENALRKHLNNNPWPARNPEQNIADLLAQVAANNRGKTLLREFDEQQDSGVVRRYMSYVLNNAEQVVRDLIGTLSNGSFKYEMDSGEVIAVDISIDKVLHIIDINFSGTSRQSSSNFNAPESISRAAVLYVLRTLAQKKIPLNAGFLRPVNIHIPEGSLLSPDRSAAVVAGNVETSQCIVDALFAALGKLAASQGTMNNFTFGNAQHQYYETLSGGSGAGPAFDGCDTIQTHMTNSRLTDPEVLESRYPIRINTFAVRKNSGGNGHFSGGNGLLREYEFLCPMEVAILSNHRRIAPFGLAGGGSGSTGINTVVRKGKPEETLSATASLQLNTGDKIRIATPGGGGYGNILKSETAKNTRTNT
ncbi:MAG: hydantoinase B/oxoprolinase family protein [Gammaproteobacteria bacterium]|nr:hydantoinase B/oxoprolinase family protein [Gammaproteobacteria bacterium]